MRTASLIYGRSDRLLRVTGIGHELVDGVAVVYLRGDVMTSSRHFLPVAKMLLSEVSARGSASACDSYTHVLNLVHSYLRRHGGFVRPVGEESEVLSEWIASQDFGFEVVP